MGLTAAMKPPWKGRLDLIINLLCVGDVVGSPGRMILARALPRLVREHDLHCTIVNAENVASGSGLTPSLYQKLIDSGVDLMTMGDHVFRRTAIIETMESSGRIVRPANLSPAAPGREYVIFQTASGHAVALLSLLGRMYMRLPSDCPFRAADRVLNALPKDVKIVVVDLHGEATSEKVAMGWYLDGRVSVLFGSHTHVPTADERILPRGTAYITDVGMTGPHDSVLGRNKEPVIRSMTTNVPSPFDVATGDLRLNGIVVSVDSITGKATSIRRVVVGENDTAEDAAKG